MSLEPQKKEKHEKLNPKEVRNVKLFCLIMGIANILCIILMSIFWSPYEWPIFLGLGILGVVPAFIANAGMTFAGTIGKPGTPMDFGRNFIDGKRIFGPGKTWKGLLGGILIGSTVSWLFVLIYFPLTNAVIGLPSFHWERLGIVNLEEVLFFTQPKLLNLVLRTILLAVGAAFGDAIGSFIKRRFDKPRGAQFPILDQIDFLIFAILCAYIVFPMPWYYILTICLFTPLVVILANIVAYYLGHKQVPW